MDRPLTLLLESNPLILYISLQWKSVLKNSRNFSNWTSSPSISFDETNCYSILWNQRLFSFKAQYWKVVCYFFWIFREFLLSIIGSVKSITQAKLSWLYLYTSNACTLMAFLFIDCCTESTIGIWMKLNKPPNSSIREKMTPCDWIGKDKSTPIDSNGKTTAFTNL